MNIRKKYATILCLAASGLLCGSVSAQLASPLYEFTFNDSQNNTQTANTGSLGGSANMTNYVESGSTDRQSADLHSANGLGLTELPGDYALNTTLATRMGGSGAVNGSGAGYGGMGQIVGGGNALQGSSSFTIAGWYNTASATKPGNYARLIEFGQGLGVWFQGTGSSVELQLSLVTTGAAGSKNYASSAPLLLTENQWTFFAFSYSQNSGNSDGTVILYAGTKTADVAEISRFTVENGGTVNMSSGSTTPRDLVLANSNGNGHQRPFQGLLDNFRVWGDSDGNGGALDLAELQRVRIADLNNSPIPEPTTTALLTGAALAALIALRHRCRS